MTKLRPPLTFENALTRVAGVIGWEKTAGIVGHAERTVRNWSEPDTTARISLEAAFRLDIAYQAAGGEDAPFLLCYATRLDAELLAATSDRHCLVASTARASKESGEAIAAALAVARPGATPADIAIAERELEESIEAKTSVLAKVRAIGRMLMGTEPARAPEVAPPPGG